jgi:hypothetical protein
VRRDAVGGSRRVVLVLGKPCVSYSAAAGPGLLRGGQESLMVVTMVVVVL